MRFDPCIYPGELLLPAEGVNLTAWASLACDQFTSQPEYWREARELAGGRPSTLCLTLPECDLGEAGARVPAIHQAMRDYLADDVLAPAFPKGFVLTERQLSTGARAGLVALVDLESYDPRPGSQSPVRATEGVIDSRVPPRLAIRRGAALETGHALLLIDDPAQTVIEPLFDRRRELRQLYDLPLMMGGGHLTGYAVTDEDDMAGVYAALEALWARAQGLLFAVGDGNHSLAAAKRYWEEVKPGLAPEATAAHPARFAMVEVLNLRDDALLFEPIHRVVFGADGDALLPELCGIAARAGRPIAVGDGEEEVMCVYEGKSAALDVTGERRGELAVAALQALLDEWLAAHPAARVDYVHGSAAARELAEHPDTVAFLMPRPDKAALLPTVRAEGALPRKTFSLGEARDKRYYMECRRM